MGFAREASVALTLLVMSCAATLLLTVVLELVAPGPAALRRPAVALWRTRPLLDLRAFHLLASPAACHPLERVDALLVVTSHAAHRQARTAARSGMPSQLLAKLHVRRVFLLAVPHTGQLGYGQASQEQVLDEASDHSDIVQGDFLEDYRNLSYKHAMGLQWAVEFCPGARLLVKADDDIAVHVPRLLALAPTLLHEGNMLGYVLDGMRPERGAVSKWRVTHAEWPRDSYPRFLSGWMYVTSISAASKVLASLGADFFWIDDVFVTGVGAARAGLALFDLSPYFALDADSARCCVQRRRCSLVAAPCGADWLLLERFLRLSRTPTPADGGACVLTRDPDQLPLAPGRGNFRPVPL